MKKKLVIVLLLSLFIFSAMGINAYAAAPENITPLDTSGAFRAYLNNPQAVAAGEINGNTAIIAVEYIELTNSSRLAVYYENGGENLFTVPLTSYPKKIIIYSHYLLILDEIISVYDIDLVNKDLDFSANFELTGIIIADFSVSGNTMFLLTVNKTVYKYGLNDNGTSIDFVETDNFAFNKPYEIPEEIAAIDEDNFLLKQVQPFSVFKADIDGNMQKLNINNSGYNIRFSGGILYLHNDNSIYAYYITNAVDGAELSTIGEIHTVTSDRPKSNELHNILNIYLSGEKLYICDGYLDKIVSYDITGAGNELSLTYSKCLSSYSYDEGRFYNPSNVSSNGTTVVSSSGTTVVCDKGRIQLFDNENNVIDSIYLDTDPLYCCIDGNQKIYYADSNGVYKADYKEGLTKQDFTEIYNTPDFVDIKDIKLSSDNKLFMLTDTALYLYETDGFISKITVSGGIKISVNIKSHDIFILTENKIFIYNKNYIQKDGYIDIDNGFTSIETDFEENIYLFKENFLQGQTAAKKLDNADYNIITEYVFNGIGEGSINGTALNSDDGSIYFTSKDTHTVYCIEKDSMAVSVAGDIPLIPLDKNPENIDFSADCKIIQIIGYPSTIFYPFNENSFAENYYPSNIAFSDTKISDSPIPVDEKLLSVYQTVTGYYAVFYNGKLGFILNENTQEISLKQTEYEGEIIFNSNIYNIPYFAKDDGNNTLFVTDNIEKWERVNVIGELESYNDSIAAWLYIEYGGQRGYINKNAVIQYEQPPQMPFIQGSISDVQQTVNIYNSIDGEIIGTVNGGESIKIYYDRGDYTYIGITDGQENEIKGYIQKSFIAVDNSFEKRRTGFIMLLGTIGIGIILIFVKRKFLY